jgi:hypothetical protein
VLHKFNEMIRGKLSSDFKPIFQANEKRVEKIEEFIGHKLRDILAYP